MAKRQNEPPKELQELRERMLNMAFNFLVGHEKWVKQDEIPSIRKIKDAANELENHILRTNLL